LLSIIKFKFIEDKSTVNGIQVTFWNQLSLYYHSINVGDLLLIENYKISKNKRNNFENKNDVEISLNYNSSKVYKLDEKLQNKLSGYSPINLDDNLTTINELILKNDKKIFSIVGIIINKSRIERERSQLLNENKFYQYYYLTLIDDSSEFPIKIKIYLNTRNDYNEYFLFNFIALIFATSYS
jgi:hypothetical protein